MALKITSRSQFKEFCLRKLGKPVIEINIDCQQCEDRIDEALCYWMEYHDDALVKTYVKHEVTATDVANEYITLPEDIMSVTSVLPFDSVNSTSNWTSFQYQFANVDLIHLWRTGGSNGQMPLTSYQQAMSYYSQVDMLMNEGRYIISDFNRLDNRLYLDGVELTEGNFVVVEAMLALDPQTVTGVYTDFLLMRLATALLKQQWGTNLKKFEGMQLPGGVTFNGQQIYEEATEEISKIEEEFQTKYSTPPKFFVG
jgi:hypothetical protein